MDLLFKRYASPFDYLDALLQYGSFASGIKNIWEEHKDERNWQFYLSLNPFNDKSFTEWKKEMDDKQNNKKPMSRAEIDATVEKSQKLLQGFKPPTT